MISSPWARLSNDLDGDGMDAAFDVWKKSPPNYAVIETGAFTPDSINDH